MDAKMVGCGAFVDSSQVLLLNVLGLLKEVQTETWTSLVPLPSPALAKPHSVLSYSAAQA